MKLVKLNINEILEASILIIFLAIFLSLAIAIPWGKTIEHAYPYSYGASDAFFHQSVAEYMQQQGVIKFTPPWEVGGYEGVYDAHPPMLFELSALLSNLTGLQTYDTIFFISALLLAMSALIMYILIRHYNKHVALLSLPITLLTMAGKSKISLLWGYWLFIAGVFFLLAAFWALSRINLKNSYLLLGILTAAMAIAHIPEAAFIALFIALYWLVDLIRNKRVNIQLTKTIIIANPIISSCAFFGMLFFAIFPILLISGTQ